MLSLTKPRHLLTRFAPRVEIAVSPDAFTFSTSRRSLSLGTSLTLAQGKKGTEIVSVGDFSPVGPGTERVHLFSISPTDRQAELLGELLTKFLAAGLRQVIGRPITLRPRVVFLGVGSLDSFLSGYQGSLLRHAALRAGASTVEVQR